MTEIQAAGPRGRALQRDVRRRYAETLMRARRGSRSPLTPELATAVVGGIDALLAEAGGGRPRRRAGRRGD